MNIVVEGADKLAKQFKGMGKGYRPAVRTALKKCLLDLKGKAVKLAPIKTSDLRKSAYTAMENYAGEVGFAEVYALRQHEELGYEHPKGGQAKFLEQPYKENIDTYVKWIGDEVLKEILKA